MSKVIIFLCLLALGSSVIAETEYEEYAVDADEDFAIENLDFDDSEESNDVEEEEENDEDDEEEDDGDDDTAVPTLPGQPSKIEVHVYVPVQDAEKETPKTDFPAFPGSDDTKADAPASGNKGDFLSDHIGIFQNRVASIVKRLKSEKVELDKEDKRLDAHLAAIKEKIAKAKKDIADLLEQQAKMRSDAIKAAQEKELRDKMRSHPILSKLYTARKFVIELKRMVRALQTMDPNSAEYAETLGKIQGEMAKAQDESTGLKDLDEMLAVSNIANIELDKVRDDEISGLNGVLCAMMKHIQAKINKWEAKLRQDHENALAAAAASHSRKLADARKRLADAEAELANYQDKLAAKHKEIKAKLARINAELRQLGAIDGHVTKYRRTRVAEAEENAKAEAEGKTVAPEIAASEAMAAKDKKKWY